MRHFYTYHQNNSGGSFLQNNDVDEVVYIEADDNNHADRIALDKGMYFNGVEEGFDCDCCGDRWHPTYEDGPLFTVEDNASVWDISKEIDKDMIGWSRPAVVHLKNGQKFKYNPSNFEEII